MIIHLILVSHFILSNTCLSHVCDPMQTGHTIASALNVAQTLHSYGDFMIFTKAAESKQV